tara:strand:- start:1270 stop:1719 length:450 start_codon:yes stop_codon:yes gene_type:complete
MNDTIQTILGLKDFIVVDESVNSSEDLTTEEAELENEALSISQRRAKGRVMKRNKAKMALGRRRASKKIATMDKLKKRARKQARELIVKKLTKDIPKSELSVARKMDIEKRMDRPAVRSRIDRLARKGLPKVRQAEIQKKRGRKPDDNA